MLQVRNWLLGIAGESVLLDSFKVVLSGLATFLIVYTIKKRLGIFRPLAIVSIFILGYIFAISQPFFSEKTHVLSYGLLGFLAARDLSGNYDKSPLKYILRALIFAALIGALDEAFQGILPYRYAEIRDFITNIISSALGISLFLVTKGRTLPLTTSRP